VKPPKPKSSLFAEGVNPVAATAKEETKGTTEEQRRHRTTKAPKRPGAEAK
jgi:hypothetical protein